MMSCASKTMLRRQLGAAFCCLALLMAPERPTSRAAAPFKRVLDQPSDVLLVFDDEHAMPVHVLPDSTGITFRAGIGSVKCGLICPV